MALRPSDNAAGGCLLNHGNLNLRSIAVGGMGSYCAEMGTAKSSEKEKAAWLPDVGRRRSMRVLLSVPIFVSGKSTAGKDFEEETRTLVVNAHGALISLAAPVKAGQTVTVENRATQMTQDCRVVYLGTVQAGKTQMGLEFLRASPTFWQIDFPPDDWVVPEN